MDPQEFAQQMPWEQSGQGSYHTDVRIIVGQDGAYTLRDLKSSKDFEFTGPDAEQQCSQALTTLLTQGRSKVQ